MTDLTPDQTQTELIERGGLVIASLVAHSWGGEAAIAVGDLIAEIQRLDGAVDECIIEIKSTCNASGWWNDPRCYAFVNKIKRTRDNRYPK